ncbi:MAG: extracellular solute-binding protein [Firmicutes bacterium]|nr:extracellular solute-binding protein [Bacillota bacterium]
MFAIFGWRRDGKLYAIPLNVQPVAMYYNATELKKSGLERPRAGWTWDDLRQYAQKLTRRNDSTITTWGLTAEVWDGFYMRSSGRIVDI